MPQIAKTPPAQSLFQTLSEREIARARKAAHLIYKALSSFLLPLQGNRLHQRLLGRLAEILKTDQYHSPGKLRLQQATPILTTLGAWMKAECIKNLAEGRKNYLFCGSHDAAKRGQRNI